MKKTHGQIAEMETVIGPRVAGPFQGLGPLLLGHERHVGY